MKKSTRQFLKQIGARILELRTYRELTQEQLAERIDMSPRQLQRLEAGETDVALSRVIELSAALGVNLSSLLKPPRTRIDRKPGRPKRRLF